MKNIKDLCIKTQEGFSVKNLKRFPSMEYGEEGGLECDIYYHGNKVITLYDAGDGGCARCEFTDYGESVKETLKRNALSFVKRKDRDWDKYDFLKNKTSKNFDDDDWLSLVNLIEDRYYDVKALKKIFKQGHTACAIVSNDFTKIYLQYKCDGVTYQEVKDYLVENKLDKKYPYIDLWLASMDLEVF